MPRIAATLPRVQIHIRSGNHDIGVGNEADTPLPDIRSILRTTFYDSLRRAEGGVWGSTIQVSYPSGLSIVLPTWQCAVELGVPVNRLHIEPIDWTNGVSRGRRS